jgi:predicted CoA-substrate-specific enzyme activase
MNKTKYSLGIDVGSISICFALIDQEKNVVQTLYLRTFGDPVKALRKGFKSFKKHKIASVGVTGSGRNFIGTIIGADVIFDEITAHATSVLLMYPKVKTIIEIGGQDSKFIQLEKGVSKDFNMNAVCAAGTGSFLDQQAARLGINIEDFGEIALKSKKPTKIAGRCTVFAESDMIHKQQAGYKREDILAGLCDSLALNYLSTVAMGKKLDTPILFLGGVAANKGMEKAFNKILSTKVIIPKYYNCMGAIGAAILALENMPKKSKFKGFGFFDMDFIQEISECKDCPNRCELIHVYCKEKGKKKKIAVLGSFCGKYQ